MSDIARNIMDVAAQGEMNAAARLLASEQAEKARQQEKAELAALKAKQAEQKALFRKEIEPATQLFQSLKDAGLAFEDGSLETKDNSTKIKLELLGFRYAVVFATPHYLNGEGSHPDYHYEYHGAMKPSDYLRKASFEAGDIEESNDIDFFGEYPSEDDFPSQMPERINQSEKKYEILGPYFSKKTSVARNFMSVGWNYLYNRDGNIERSCDPPVYNFKQGDAAPVFRGLVFSAVEFERGNTTPEDVQRFITKAIQMAYEQNSNNPEKLAKLREIIKDQFNVDLESVTESARMVAVARNFRALADSNIQIAKPNTELDYNILDKTPDEIRTEVAEALESKDAMAILRVGSDILDLSTSLIAELTNEMLPAAIGDDYRLIQTIQKDLEMLSLNKGQPKQTIGTALLNKMRLTRTEVAVQDPHADISTNFRSLASSLIQRREVVERRVAAVASKSESLEKISALLSIYQKEIDSALEKEQDPIKSSDLSELKDIFAVNAIASKSGKVGVRNAVASEKKAFLALKKTSNVIPLLAASLIQAINTMRARQAGAMDIAADQATQVLLEDLSDGAKKQALQVGTDITQVIEMAKDRIDVIEGHVREVHTHLEESESTIRDSALEAQDHLAR